MKTALVLTTIHVPTVLKSYIDNCRRYGHRDVAFIVIGDLKTPPQCLRYLNSLKKSGYAFIYLGPREQNEWLKKHPDLKKMLPFNSIQRRNIGYLLAVQRGADVLISIDDDNYAVPGIDYIKAHGKVGTIRETAVISSSCGWVNLCSYLKTSPAHAFYHRGFPLNKRWLQGRNRIHKMKKRVVVNAGFWLGDPDVDTITRLEEPFKVIRSAMPCRSMALAKHTSHPFNSQNTAFYKDVLPCMFLITLGRVNSRLTIDNFRFDDIWMSYFLKKAADVMDDLVAFGEPMVVQRRNPHDLLKDLEKEFLPSLMTPKLVEILDNIKLSSSSYSRLYEELSFRLQDSVLAKKILTPLEQDCLRKTAQGMRIWLKSCAAL